MNKENKGNSSDYENLFGDNVKMQVEVAKTFKEWHKIPFFIKIRRKLFFGGISIWIFSPFQSILINCC